MKLNAILLLIIALHFLPSPVCAEKYHNSYVNKDIASSSNYFKDNFKNQKEITKINYYINLGRSKNRRITFGGINIETTLDVEKNIAYEKIDIYYYQTMESVPIIEGDGIKTEKKLQPNLIGENISFTLNEFDDNSGGANDLIITAVTAPGWDIMTLNNSSSSVFITNREENIFGNHINIFIEIKNQDKYQGRQFEIYNRDVIDFSSIITINNNYEFTKFNPNLPFKFKSEESIKSFEDYYDIYSDSAIISNQITKNKIYFNAWLQGNDYHGNDSFGNLVHEKIINFDYSYDYQENVNARIVEENKKSTEETLNEIKTTSEESNNLAIKLFTISILISFISLVISLFSNYIKLQVQKLFTLSVKVIKKIQKFFSK